ncbi:MAG: helix-turn-helix domain-containing protein, partial [Bacteroidota bacterium]
MTDQELEQLLLDLESDRVERKEAPTDGDRIRQAICAFANDMPDNRLPGIVFVGARDDGSPAGLAVTDEILLNLACMRDDGNILPLPAMTVQKRVLCGGEMAVIEVRPADAPPVRFKGKTWIRVGPRRAIASAQDERILNERRRARDLPYDLHPVQGAAMGDLDLELFRREYLPAAIAPEVLAENGRPLEQQLASLRFVTADTPPVPTVTGLLVTGNSPVDFVPGAYIQFLRIDGQSLTDPIADSKEIHGPLPQILRRLDEIMEANIRTAL